MFAIVLYGDLRIGEEHKDPLFLKIGDMLGHQNLAEQNMPFMAEKWKYEVVAHTDGILAVLPYGDLKQE